QCSMTAIELLPGHVAPRGIGSIPMEEILAHSGLEILQGLMEGRYPAPPIAAIMNFSLAEVSEGRAVFEGLPGEAHLNPLGGVHGGWTATILDSALACCVHTTLARG